MQKVGRKKVGRKRTADPTRKVTSLVIPEALLVKVKVAAAQERMDMSRWICRVIERALRRTGGPR